MSFRVIVCGSRNWRRAEPIRALLARLKEEHYSDVLVIAGGAPGADSVAAMVCRALGITCREILADWAGKGKAAGPARNARMLTLSPHEVHAFKDDIDASLSRGGTENMLRQAIKAQIPAFVHGSDGSCLEIELCPPGRPLWERASTPTALQITLPA